MMQLWKWIVRIATLASIAWAAWYWVHGPTIEQGSYLVLDLSGSFSEARPNGLVGRLFHQGHSLGEVTEALRKVRHDGRIAGVVARTGKLDCGWAQAEEIRSALAEVKAAGKRVVAELDVELAPASKEIFVASAADTVYVTPAAAPLLIGLSAHSVFLGGLWPKIDVAMQVEQVGEYKSAGDELARESMSPAQREMLDAILDDVSARFVRTVSSARNIAAADLQKAIDRGVSRPRQLVETGVANGVRSHQEVLVELGGKNAAPTVDEQVYSRVRAASLGIDDGPVVAIVHAVGTVQTGKSPPGGGSFGSDSIAAALAEAAGDKGVSAIVLRVASPGGSPAASDEIWLAIREAAKKKPVVASLGDVAASGGYYLASAADRIVAAPGTLTGSIGVVFFKPDVSALLSRIGVHTATLQRGRFSSMFDLDRSLDAEELSMVRSQIADVYQLFLERVATGRKKKVEEIDRIGAGRVWTGQQAFERGLVDEVGTMEDAVRAAANAAGIHDIDKVQLVHYPKGDTLVEQMAELGAGASAAMAPPLVTRIQALLGDSASLLTLEPGVAVVADSVPMID
ncbi:MAG TPA: signal peptide peptidase SppA [Candidatus Binatia bacterium]|jgi:protease-4